MRRSTIDHQPDSAPARERSGSGSLHVGKGAASPVTSPSLPGDGLPLPDEREPATGSADDAPRKVMRQAKRDLDAGQVDTDMHATAGLDAVRRRKLVPGPGGVPPKPR
jgi:hypothetical protein